MNNGVTTRIGVSNMNNINHAGTTPGGREATLRIVMSHLQHPVCASLCRIFNTMSAQSSAGPGLGERCLRRAVPSLGVGRGVCAEQCRPWVWRRGYAQSSAVPGCGEGTMRRAVPSLGVEGVLCAEQCRHWVYGVHYAQSSAVPGCTGSTMRRAVPVYREEGALCAEQCRSLY